MTDRYHSLTVVLEHDLRDDDCQPLINAIRQLRGVLSVDGVIADFDSQMAEARAESKMVKALIEATRLWRKT